MARMATADRWLKAAARASAENVRVLELEDGTGVVMRAANNDVIHYRTDGVYCECDAGINGDPVCKHRAAFLLLALNVLPPTGDDLMAAWWERAREYAMVA